MFKKFYPQIFSKKNVTLSNGQMIEQTNRGYIYNNLAFDMMDFKFDAERHDIQLKPKAAMKRTRNIVAIIIIIIGLLVFEIYFLLNVIIG